MGRMSPQQRETYESGVAFLRRLANSSPRFKVVERDGVIVIVDGRLENGDVLLRVESGPQAATVVKYFNHIGYYLLIDLLGLLEQAPGTKAESKAVELLLHMHLPPGDDRQGRSSLIGDADKSSGPAGHMT